MAITTTVNRAVFAGGARTRFRSRTRTRAGTRARFAAAATAGGTKFGVAHQVGEFVMVIDVVAIPLIGTGAMFTELAITRWRARTAAGTEIIDVEELFIGKAVTIASARTRTGVFLLGVVLEALTEEALMGGSAVVMDHMDVGVALMGRAAAAGARSGATATGAISNIAGRSVLTVGRTGASAAHTDQAGGFIAEMLNVFFGAVAKMSVATGGGGPVVVVRCTMEVRHL